MSAVNVYFRDFRVIIPFLLQIGMYASPVVYSFNGVPEKYKMIFSMNPMVGIIEAFRWVFFESISVFPYFPFMVSIVFSLMVFCVAVFLFKKVEMYFADII
jgi:lipopolysaccharide transport system permease protein